MAEFTQDPQGQVTVAASFATPGGTAVGGPGFIDLGPSISQVVLVDGAVVGVLAAGLPPLAAVSYSVAQVLIDSLRDEYLSGGNCPPVVQYPLWGQRGPGWIPRTSLPI